MKYLVVLFAITAVVLAAPVPDPCGGGGGGCGGPP